MKKERKNFTKEQGVFNDKELYNKIEAFEAGEENLSRLLLEFDNIRIGSQQESQEDVEMTVSEETKEHQPM